ncbi:MAG: hypothetical protein U1F43_34895 [Myxococcota bacterium]
MWIQALRALLPRVAPERARALTRLLPGLLEHTGDAAAAPDPFPLHDAVAGFLGAAARGAAPRVARRPARGRPVVAVAGRAHRAVAHGARVMLMAGYRDVEARRSAPIEGEPRPPRSPRRGAPPRASTRPASRRSCCIGPAAATPR